jgi:hypothetical protein
MHILQTLDILRSPFRHFIKTWYKYAVKFGHIKLPLKRLLCKKRLFIIKNLHAHFTSVDVVNSTLGFSSRYAWYFDGFCDKK